MSEELTTPVGEVIQPETTVTTEPPAPTPAPVATVGDMLGEKKVVDSVPIARLNKEIARKKELETQVADLQAKIAAGVATPSQVTADLRSLAEEHNVDPVFLDKLASTIKARTEADMEEKLRPLAEREQNDRRERAFTEHFTKALEQMPDYKGIVNAAVIRQLAFNPENAQKTFAQLIEDTYGHALKGRSTVETAVPRINATKPDSLDMNRARTDTEYFKQIMADSTLRKEYNNSLHTRLRL